MRSFACSKERWFEISDRSILLAFHLQHHSLGASGWQPCTQLQHLTLFAVLVYLYLWKPVKSLSREKRLAKYPLAFSEELHNLFFIPSSSYLNNFICGLTLLWSDWLKSTSMLTDGKGWLNYSWHSSFVLLDSEVTSSVGLFCWQGVRAEGFCKLTVSSLLAGIQYTCQ